MAPSAQRTDLPTTQEEIEDAVSNIISQLSNKKGGSLLGSYKGGFVDSNLENLPETTKKRFAKYNIDISQGYPERPPTEEIPVYLDEAEAIRSTPTPYIERGKGADPEKKALFGAAKEIRHLTKHVGTEIVGLQLGDLNDKQKDELALLIAERVVVFFKDQDLSPQKQLELGEYYGNVEKHAQQVHVPGYRGITVIWPNFLKKVGYQYNFKQTKTAPTSITHSDLCHELQTPGITTLYNDAIPKVGGDTVWYSGYGAYDKLLPAFQKFLDGKTAIYRSAHQYIDRENPLRGPKHIEREHPIIRTHPATGWKSLYVNRGMTVRIVGLEPDESRLILNYLFDVYEKNLDIQVRFNWQSTNPESGLATAALWDNRISQHSAVAIETEELRHGTRVSALAEVPYYDPNSKSQRESLGLPLN